MGCGLPCFPAVCCHVLSHSHKCCIHCSCPAVQQSNHSGRSVGPPPPNSTAHRHRSLGGTSSKAGGILIMAMVLAASTASTLRRAAQLSGIQNAFHRVQQARKFCAAAGSAEGLGLVFGQTHCSSIPGGINHLVNLRRQFSWSTSSSVGIPGAVPGTRGGSAERSTGAGTASANSAERSTGGLSLPDTDGAEKRTGLVPHPLLTLILDWHT